MIPQKILDVLKEQNLEITSEFKGITKPITVKCNKGHESSCITSQLLQKFTCSKCTQSNLGKVSEILKDFDINPIENTFYGRESLEYTIDEHNCVLVLDNPIPSQYLSENQSTNKILVRLDLDTLNNSEKLSDFLVETLSCTEKVYYSNQELYKSISVPLLPRETNKPDFVISPIGTCNEQGEYNSLIKTNSLKPDPEQRIMVVYCRVSSEMQRKNHSIDTQEESSFRYAKQNNFFIKKIYQDIALSGKSIAERKALQMLLEELEPGTTVFFYSLSRMSRNVADSIDIVERIQKKKCTFISTDLPQECSGPTANLFLNILSTMSQFERETISKRVSDVLNNQSSKGELKTKPPFGYKYAGKGKPFEKDENEQKIIEMIRKIKKDNPHYTVAQICKTLEERGVVIRKCKKIYPARIKTIMSQNGIE